MSFLASLFRKPEPIAFERVRALNGQYLPSIRERRRRANAASVEMQFGILTARLTDEERKAAIAIASQRSVLNRQTGEGRAGK